MNGVRDDLVTQERQFDNFDWRLKDAEVVMGRLVKATESNDRAAHFEFHRQRTKAAGVHAEILEENLALRTDLEEVKADNKLQRDEIKALKDELAFVKYRGEETLRFVGAMQQELNTLSLANHISKAASSEAAPHTTSASHEASVESDLMGNSSCGDSDEAPMWFTSYDMQFVDGKFVAKEEPEIEFEDNETAKLCWNMAAQSSIPEVEACARGELKKLRKTAGLQNKKLKKAAKATNSEKRAASQERGRFLNKDFQAMEAMSGPARTRPRSTDPQLQSFVASELRPENT